MTSSINELQEEFEEYDSDIETVARNSIGVTVGKILKYFNIDIDIEEAIRERDWQDIISPSRPESRTIKKSHFNSENVRYFIYERSSSKFYCHLQG